MANENRINVEISENTWCCAGWDAVRVPCASFRGKFRGRVRVAFARLISSRVANSGLPPRSHLQEARLLLFLPVAL
jgi:hypothetical protein